MPIMSGIQQSFLPSKITFWSKSYGIHHNKKYAIGLWAQNNITFYGHNYSLL